MWSIGVLQVRVLGLVTTATRNSHFSELEVRGYPKIFDFFDGGSPEILTILVVSPAQLSSGRSFPALGPPRSGPPAAAKPRQRKPQIFQNLNAKFRLNH